MHTHTHTHTHTQMHTHACTRSLTYIYIVALVVLRTFSQSGTGDTHIRMHRHTHACSCECSRAEKASDQQIAAKTWTQLRAHLPVAHAYSSFVCTCLCHCRYDHNTRLLPYLLAAVTDDCAAVSTVALHALEVHFHKHT